MMPEDTTSLRLNFFRCGQLTTYCHQIIESNKKDRTVLCRNGTDEKRAENNERVSRFNDDNVVLNLLDLYYKR